MNINIYLEDKLGAQLTKYAQSVGQTRNYIIREALKEWITSHYDQQWSDDIMQYNGVQNFINLRNHSNDLIEPKDDPLS